MSSNITTTTTTTQPLGIAGLQRRASAPGINAAAAVAPSAAFRASTDLRADVWRPLGLAATATLPLQPAPLTIVDTAATTDTLRLRLPLSPSGRLNFDIVSSPDEVQLPPRDYEAEKREALVRDRREEAQRQAIARAVGREVEEAKQSWTVESRLEVERASMEQQMRCELEVWKVSFGENERRKKLAEEAAALASAEHITMVRRHSGPSPASSPAGPTKAERIRRDKAERSRLSVEYGIPLPRSSMKPAPRMPLVAEEPAGSSDDGEEEAPPTDGGPGDSSDDDGGGGGGGGGGGEPPSSADSEPSSPRAGGSARSVVTTFAMTPNAFPDYDGTGGTAVLRTWFYNVERRAKQLRIDKRTQFRDMVELADSTVTRRVGEWYTKEFARRKKDKDPRAKVTTWRQFKEAFLHFYGTFHEDEAAMVDWHTGAMSILANEGMFDYMARMIEFRERLPVLTIPNVTFVDKLLRTVRVSYYAIHKKLRGKCEKLTTATGAPPTLHWIRQRMAEISRTITLDAVDAKAASGGGGGYKIPAHQQAASGDQSGEVARLTKQLESARQNMASMERRRTGRQQRQVNAVTSSAAPAEDHEAPAPRRRAAAAQAAMSGPAPGVAYTTEQIQQLRDGNRCFKCGRVGHRKLECRSAAVDLRPSLAPSN